MRFVRRSDLRAAPWKNGGGVTYELAAFPNGAGFEDFVWRLSLAQVAADGPFSAFPGIDRTLTLIEGAGIALDFSGAAVTLAPGAAPFAFPGEAPVVGRLVEGAILDFNVMTRRGRAVHNVRIQPAGEKAPAATRALVSRRAGVNVAGHRLDVGDAVLAGRGETLAGVSADGELIAVEIAPVNHGAALASNAQVW